MVNISIRQRLTLWYTAAMAALLGVIALSLILVHGRVGLLHLDAELARVNATVAAVLQHELDEGLAPGPAAENCLAQLSLPGRHVAIFSSDRRLLARRWALSSPPGRRPVGEDRPWTIEGAPRVRLVEASRGETPQGFVIVSGATWDELDADRRDIINALAMVIPLGLLLAAAGSWWVAGRALTPAARMAAEAQRITEDSLGSRLTVLRHDELGRLATTFNGLLDRLESALSIRRQFLADASHELRTPVSIAKNAADVALSRRDRTGAEYREALSIVSEQMKGLGRMVSDMLALARSDASDWPLVPHSFYLDELLAEIVRSTRVLAADRQVTVEANAPPDLEFLGDESLVRRMFMNLLDNGIRHTPRGGVVRVTAISENGHIGVRVQDSGNGIPDAERDRIFDRFVRLDPSGDRDGVGLGLAIARRIARAHRGDLAIVDTSPSGTTFEVTLPRVAENHAHSVPNVLT